MSRCRLLLILAGCALLVVVVGCGGGGPGARPGQLHVSLRFPVTGSVAPSLVPTNAQSVVVTVLLASGTPIGSAILNRPAGAQELVEAWIDNLPPGPVIVKAVAYEGRDGTGAPLARAATTAVIFPGETTTVYLTLNPIVDSVHVSPTSLRMIPGGHEQLTAWAEDASHAVIIGADLNFTSDNTAVATVTPSEGRVTAVAIGSTTIQVVYDATEIQAQAAVNVVEGLGPVMIGFYQGDFTQTGLASSLPPPGTIRFILDSSFDVHGRVVFDGCPEGFYFTGHVDPTGTIMWTGTGCGVEYIGIGVIERAHEGSWSLVSHGTWTGSDGSSGTWGAPRTGDTGSIG